MKKILLLGSFLTIQVCSQFDITDTAAQVEEQPFMFTGELIDPFLVELAGTSYYFKYHQNSSDFKPFFEGNSQKCERLPQDLCIGLLDTDLLDNLDLEKFGVKKGLINNLLEKIRETLGRNNTAKYEETKKVACILNWITYNPEVIAQLKMFKELDEIFSTSESPLEDKRLIEAIFDKKMIDRLFQDYPEDFEHPENLRENMKNKILYHDGKYYAYTLKL